MTSKFNQMAATDEEEVRRTVPMPVQKAKVTRVPEHPDEDGFHQVYVQLHYDQSQERATVLTGKHGDVSIPEEGEDVMVLFGATDKPVILGSFYPVDDEFGNPNVDDVPEYDEGDRIIGNGGGSYLAIRDDGTVEIITDGFKPINVDRQSAVAHITSQQEIPGDDQFYLVEFDSEEDDKEDLFDPSTHTMTARHGGTYEINGSVAFAAPDQNNRYTLSVYVNGSRRKRKSRQSVVNKELSLDITLNARLDSGDTIDIRVRQDSGSTKSLVGQIETNDFTIERSGI